MNMPLSSEALGVIECLNEAVMIVSADGTVVCMNRTAKRSLGQALVGRSLFELIEGDREAVTTFIQRSLSSSSPLIGAMNLRTDSGCSICSVAVIDCLLPPQGLPCSFGSSVRTWTASVHSPCR